MTAVKFKEYSLWCVYHRTASSQAPNQNPHIPGQPQSLQAQRAQDKSF